jgi:hypothetical protein
MGSDKSADRYRGLLIPDPRVTPASLWEAQSSYSETGPRPDVPTLSSTSPSALTLDAAGEVYASQEGKDLRVRAQVSGMPGASANPAGFVWKNEGDALFRGWDSPNAISGWESVVWTDGGGIPVGTYTPHAITLPDDSLLVAYRSNTAGPTNEVTVQKRTPTTGAWTSATAIPGAGLAGNLNPCLLLLPSGRVLLFAWISGADSANVQVYYSDDDGVTWALATESALPEDILFASSSAVGTKFEIGRLRAAYFSGSVVLVAGLVYDAAPATYADTFQQYGSTDLGLSFSKVGEPWDGGFGVGDSRTGGFQDLVAVAAGLRLFYITPIGNDFNYRTIGSPFDAFETAEEEEPTLTLGDLASSAGTPIEFTGGDLAVWKDPSGSFFAAVRLFDHDNALTVIESHDGGDKWAELGASNFASVSGTVWNTDDAATYPRAFTATSQGGRGVLLHNWTATPGNEDNSLGAMYLGGYSSLTFPPLTTLRAFDKIAGWDFNYLPFDLPSDIGWALTGGGSAALGGGRLELHSTGVANSAYYSRNPTGTIAEGMLFKISLTVTAAGSWAADHIAARLRLADGANDYDVSIRFSTGPGTLGYRVRDQNGATTVGTSVVDTALGVDVAVGLEAGEVRTWYRLRGMGPDREWIAGAGGAIATDAATPAANHMVRFGRLSPAALAACDIYEVHYTTGSDSGYSLAGVSGKRWGEDPMNPDDLAPRAYPAGSSFSPVAGGITLSTIDGPAVRPDEHSVKTRYRYAVERMLPGSDEAPSPRIRWRSKDETEQTIALGLNPAALLSTEDAYLGNDAIGVALLGVNFKTAILQGYATGSATWSDLATLDAAEALAPLAWTRKGGTVRATSGGTNNSEPYFQKHELEGGSFVFDGAGARTIRRISTNTAGAWASNLSVNRNAEILVEDATGTEGASDTAGEIWTPHIGAVVDIKNAQYSAYRLKIPGAQGTVEGFYEVGSFVVGPMFIFGDSYSWGRGVSLDPNVELSESRDWTTRAKTLSPARRAVEFGWTDGVDETGLDSVTSSPNYTRTTTTPAGLPTASKGEVIRQLEGHIRALGSEKPVVYFPRIDKSTTPANDVRLYNRRAEFVFGRIIGGIRRDTVLGDELTSELVRASKVVIREEV